MTIHGRVLVIDEELTALEMYARQLGSAGFEVSKASDRREAVGLLDSNVFDLVVSDVEMPGLDGATLASRLLERRSDASVILTSPKPLTGSIRLAIAERGFHFVRTPVGPGVLERVAIRALKQRAGLIFDNRKGDEVELVSFNATDLKNKFSTVLDRALSDGATVITKHDVPKAVLLSWAEYNAMTIARRTQLQALTADFDGLLSRMQTPNAQQAARAAFDASPAKLGIAAVNAGRKAG